jgi:hypothetical protein
MVVIVSFPRLQSSSLLVLGYGSRSYVFTTPKGRSHNGVLYCFQWFSVQPHPARARSKKLQKIVCGIGLVAVSS